MNKKEVKATTYLEVMVECPHCSKWQNILDEASEYIGDDLRAEDIECYITCEDCKKEFIVTEINY